MDLSFIIPPEELKVIIDKTA